MKKTKEIIYSIRYNWRPVPDGGEKYHLISVADEAVKRIFPIENELGQRSFIVEFTNGKKKEIFNPNEIEYVIEESTEIYLINIKQSRSSFSNLWYNDPIIGVLDDQEAVFSESGHYKIINNEEHAGKRIHPTDVEIISKRTATKIL